MSKVNLFAAMFFLLALLSINVSADKFDVLIREGTGDNSFMRVYATTYPGLPEDIGAEYSINEGMYAGNRVCFASVYEFSSSEEAQSTNPFDALGFPFKLKTMIFDSTPVYVNTEKNFVLWTSGKFWVVTGTYYSDEIICPDMINAYLKKYPSDLQTGEYSVFDYKKIIEDYLNKETVIQEEVYEPPQLYDEEELVRKAKQINKEVMEVCEEEGMLKDGKCTLETLPEEPGLLNPRDIESYAEAVEENKRLAEQDLGVGKEKDVLISQKMFVDNREDASLTTQNGGDDEKKGSKTLLKIMVALGNFVKKLLPFG